MRRYRELQLITQMYNNTNATAIIPIIFFTMIFLGTMSIFVCVALHSVLSTAVLLMTAMIAFDCAILAQIFMYQAAGDVNHVAHAVTSNWQSNPVVQRDKLLVRMMRSLNVIRLKIGSSGNYLERMTPLIITQITMEQATSLILMKG